MRKVGAYLFGFIGPRKKDFENADKANAKL